MLYRCRVYPPFLEPKHARSYRVRHSGHTVAPAGRRPRGKGPRAGLPEAFGAHRHRFAGGPVARPKGPRALRLPRDPNTF